MFRRRPLLHQCGGCQRPLDVRLVYRLAQSSTPLCASCYLTRDNRGAAPQVDEAEDGVYRISYQLPEPERSPLSVSSSGPLAKRMEF